MRDKIAVILTDEAVQSMIEANEFMNAVFSLEGKTQDMKRLESGNWEVMITREHLLFLDDQRILGESFSDAIIRGAKILKGLKGT